MSSCALVVGIVVLVFLAFVPAEVAQAKGRSFWGWYFLGLFLVLPALAGALLLKRSDCAQEPTLPDLEFRDCPFCVGIIPSDAVICPRCDRDLMPPTPEPVDRWSPDADEVANRAWRAVEGNL
jgi:hypothetical protein